MHRTGGRAWLSGVADLRVSLGRFAALDAAQSENDSPLGPLVAAMMRLSYGDTEPVRVRGFLELTLDRLHREQPDTDDSRRWVAERAGRLSAHLANVLGATHHRAGRENGATESWAALDANRRARDRASGSGCAGPA